MRCLRTTARIIPPLLLAACSGSGGDGNQVVAPPDLEAAAIERGVVRDPGDRDVAGLYARDTDRVCVVPTGGQYRIGAFVDYGDGLNCTGTGTARRSGDVLSIELRAKGSDGCAFEAKFDGDRISFPGILPDECRRLCGPRASFAALDVQRLSESAAEAIALRSPDGSRLCEG